MTHCSYHFQGINFLIDHGLLNRAREDLAIFLYQGADLKILNKVFIGEYFGTHSRELAISDILMFY